MTQKNTTEFFEGLRNQKFSNSDLYTMLLERANPLDILYVDLIEESLSNYLIVNKQKKTESFTQKEIDLEIEKRKAFGIPIFYFNGMTNKKDFVTSERLNIEELMFPYEFSSLHQLQDLIKNEIKPYLLSNKETTTSQESGFPLNIDYNTLLEYLSSNKKDLSIQSKHIFHGSKTEFIELIKSLIENQSLKGIQKNIIRDLAIFFDVEIKNPDKLIQDIKSRNNGSETLFLDKLKSSLLNYIKK